MKSQKKLFVLLGAIAILGLLNNVSCDDTKTGDGETVDNDSESKKGTQTDSETVAREEEAIKIDGLNVSQMKELREKSEKHHFQAEVDRMMKLIINSLYKNKEIFLRELISNSSDALDKIRFMSLTDASAFSATDELSIKIRANKEDNSLHIIDTGIGMTRDEMVKNLGTIAKSGTSEFINKMTDSKTLTESSDLIGQFGVGFYSSFLAADRVTVISKHNSDEQYIWESDTNSFSIVKDPRGATLKRGTEIILHLKEEAKDYLEVENLRNLIKKYSQFINFPIHLWASKTEMVEEKKEESAAEEKKDEQKKDEDATVEEEKEKDKDSTKKVEKTVWDWELINTNKPIWTRKPADIKDEEYTEFYKAFSKNSEDPLTKVHFVAEGEVTFKSILFVPKKAPVDMFSNGLQNTNNIKMFVRRVFITDNFEDMFPRYLNFIHGVVDSDDLPLNVSRENLQQHKLLKVIKKKLVRKTLDMIKKLSKEDFAAFWKEFSTNVKLGVIEDNSNRTRLSKLLRFRSSHSEEQTSLGDYVGRMKKSQEQIYYMAGQNKEEVKNSPFVERLLKKGYEVLYLVEPVDEYTVQALPEFEGKKFQNVAKEGVKLGDSVKTKEKKEAMEKTYEPLINWMKDDALKEFVEKVEISDRLISSPCALVANSYGWSGNMERLMRAQAYQKAEDPSQSFYANQKKILEINPRHPLIKELKSRVETNKDDPTTKDLALVLLDSATLRSGFFVKDTASFSERIEKMLRLSMNIDINDKVEEEEDNEAEEETPEVKPTDQQGEETPKKTDEETEDKSDAEAKLDTSHTTEL